MTNPLTLLYLTLGVLIVIVEVQRIRSGKSFNALSLFNVAYFLLFVFAPLNVLILGEIAVRQKHAYQTWSHGDMWTAIALLTSYVFFVLGYYSRRRNSAVIIHNVGPKVFHVSLWLVGSYFLLGFIALAYHVSLMGGSLKLYNLRKVLGLENSS